MGYALAAHLPSQPGDISQGYALSRGANVTASVVIPQFGGLYQLPRWFHQIPSWVDEVLLVAEADKRPEDSRMHDFPFNVRVIRHPASSKQNALATGLTAAAGDIIVVMADDGSHDPNEIPMLYNKLLDGTHYVVGSRFRQGGDSAHMGFVRRWRNRGLTMAANVLFGGHYTDLCYGYVAFWRCLLPDLEVERDEGYDDANLTVALNLRALRCGLKVCEIPSREKSIGQDTDDVSKQLSR